MPTRKPDGDDGRRSTLASRHSGQQATGRRVPAQPHQNSSKRSAPPPVDDEWDEIMSIDTKKGGGGGEREDGYSKKSLGFWLKTGESCEISFIDEAPTILQGHVLKCSGEGKNGSYTFFRTEACGKADADGDCVFCDNQKSNAGISVSKRIIMARIIDGRGSWSADEGDLDGEPALKFFQLPIYLAQTLGALRTDDSHDGITTIMFKLSKNENYALSPKTEKVRGGGLRFADAFELEDMDDLPTVADIYEYMGEEEGQSFIDQFVNGAPPAKKSYGSKKPAGKGGFYGNKKR